MNQHTSQTWHKSVMDQHTSQTWHKSVMDQHTSQTWHKSVIDQHTSQTWHKSVMDQHTSQTWHKSVMDQHTSQTWHKSVMDQHTSQTRHKSVSPWKPSKSATNFCLDLAPQWVFFFSFCFHIQRKASWGANSTAIQPWDLLFFFVWATSQKEMMMMKWCLMSSDVSWHIRDKLWPMPKHGSINLYVHGNQKAL